eukprot:scaffold24658_cov113-Isochrysis_galbana.AAC.4
MMHSLSFWRRRPPGRIVHIGSSSPCVAHAWVAPASQVGGGGERSADCLGHKHKPVYGSRFSVRLSRPVVHSVATYACAR